MIIRAKTFTSWMKANFSQSQLKDIGQYGADTGWYGITYYTDTCKLYNRFKNEIWEMLSDDAENFDMNIFEFIASFHRSSEVQNVTYFENLMTWYAAERIANQLTGEC